MLIKKKVRDRWRKIVSRKAAKRLKNKNFTLIANNCWGGNVYRDLDVPYHSPFVGMMIYPKDYIKLCSDLKFYMSQDLKILSHDELPESLRRNYPVGLLGDVYIVFVHYHTNEEALSKWNKRKKRINWDNLHFKFDENFEATAEDIEEFDSLPLDNKIIFTKNQYGHLENALQLKDFSTKGQMYNYDKNFEVVDWLDNKKIVKK